MSDAIDWAEWSREAVDGMQARNRAWIEHYGHAGVPYRWDLASAHVPGKRLRLD